MDEPAPVVRTIGHSNHDAGHVLSLLAQHGVDKLIDVRSAPYSRYSPQFNRIELTRLVRAHGITYEFQGQGLGGRPDDPDCYDPAGHVIYDRLEATREYREGIDEVLRSAQEGSVCLLCSEEDPSICHRALSIGHFLTELGVRVEHIRGDGRVEAQSELQGKAINRPLQGSLFEENPQRKSLHPIPRDRAPGGFTEN